MSVVLYGDQNVDGELWYKRVDLSSDLNATRTFINNIGVNGGGDTPESAYDALYKTVDELNWQSDSKRMVLLIGDAPGLEPPLTKHNREDVIQKCIKDKVKANVYPVLISIGSAEM